MLAQSAPEGACVRAYGAPILGAARPYCAPCRRAMCPPSAGVGTKKAPRLWSALFVRVIDTTGLIQKSRQEPAKPPAIAVLNSACARAIVIGIALILSAGQ